MGWSLQTGNVNLEVNAAHDVTFTDPSTGRRVTFKFAPRNLGFPINFGFFPNYTPEPGVFGQLLADGCAFLTRITHSERIQLFRPTSLPTHHLPIYRSAGKRL